MSELSVEIAKIDNIMPHPNADRLEIATVGGWNCVVGKDIYKSGDKCVYIPIDSILPPELEDKLFSESKVKLHHGRIRTIKLRGIVSQGLVVDLAAVDLEDAGVGADVTMFLGIKKYEPPTRNNIVNGSVKPRRKQNPLFKKYTDIENYKNHPYLFKEGDEVSITEKIHGSNWRVGLLPTSANTIWKKVKKLFGCLPEYEFVYGSHNVQKQELSKRKAAGFYKKDIYIEMVEKYDIKSKLIPGMIIYGEVYGDGVQKNYKYGCGQEEHKLVIFDIRVDDKYLSPDETFCVCELLDLPTVPELYRGPFNLEKVVELTKGSSVLVPEQKIREGVVIKSVLAEDRKVLKYVSDDYLLVKSNTDFH